MIRQSEIQKIANSKGLRDTQIEKDYIAGWVLREISNKKQLKEKLTFKGGTSLRKIYFGDYRLSEDLDFTYLGESLNAAELLKDIAEVISWIAAESRIILSIQETTEHETGNLNFYLGYTGPLGGRGEKKRIKVDISFDDVWRELGKHWRKYTKIK